MKGWGFTEGRAVSVSGGVRRDFLSFFHETVLAQGLELGVGAAWGGARGRSRRAGVGR